MSSKGRTLYWAVEFKDGDQITGERPNTICSLSQYQAVLERKYDRTKGGITKVSVGLYKSAQIL